MRKKAPQVSMIRDGIINDDYCIFLNNLWYGLNGVAPNIFHLRVKYLFRCEDFVKIEPISNKHAELLFNILEGIA